MSAEKRIGGGQAIAAASFRYPVPCKSVTTTALQIRDHATASSPLHIRDRNRLQFTLTELQIGVHYVRDHREEALMPATLKLFKKAPKTTCEAEADAIPVVTKPVVVEFTWS